MTAPQKPKRHHHHVWQKYLQPWTSDGSICCLQNGRIFRTGTAAIAVEKDFYKLEELTRDDVVLIKMFYDGSHPRAKEHHFELLNRLMLPFQIAKQMKDPADRAVIDQLLKYHASEALEECHAAIEASFIPSLESALNGDISFYSDDKRCPSFLNYLCTQHMRTKGVKKRVLELSPELSRVWNIWVMKLGTDVGLSLYRERTRRKLALVHNHTDVPFITSDQPAINLKGTRPRPPENLSIYYPISPRLALLLADVDEEPPFATESLTAAQVSALNGKMFDACYKQVFSESRETLKMLRRE